jgi:hypothetical protein
MGHLIVYTHPNPKSFCHAILDTVRSTLIERGDDVVVTDLYEKNFSPILAASDFIAFGKGEIPADILKEQELVTRADNLIFIETVYYFKKLLESLREDGIHDFRIKEITYDGLIIDVVSPKTCSCGAEPRLKIEEIPGLKCSEIHLHHICENCGGQHELHFCRPRLMK